MGDHPGLYSGSNINIRSSQGNPTGVRVREGDVASGAEARGMRLLALNRGRNEGGL